MTSNQPTLVVGIGASAGGLKAIEEFFDHAPPDSGMAFVVVQHLSPDFKSLMNELLSSHTKMAIHRVTDGITIEPNSIYLIPPGKNMEVSNGTLLLSDKLKNGDLNLPIDIFFRSLAREVSEKAVAIVLSGTGSDGSKGVKDIRSAGGLILAQSVDSSSFDGMPRAAIATGSVDLICEPHEMANHIVSYSADKNREKFQQQEFQSENETPFESAIFRIFRICRQRYNLDFSLYKPSTISRRIKRRREICEISTLPEYVDFVESNEDELEALFRDLLVEVTEFFRDPQAFEVLRKSAIPDLVKRANPNEEIRAWVCGCATGEEAYSVAMLIQDAIEEHGRPNQNFKVFATDVHPNSLQVASEGCYPRSALEHVPSDFIEKYLIEDDENFCVSRGIRQNVIFAANDLTRDPPFTRLDMITCRNFLIYLEPRIQKQILTSFHFGLKSKGVLFLGPSESVGEIKNEFEHIDRHWRIFKKRRDVKLPSAARSPLTPVLGSVVQKHREQTAAVSPPNIKKQTWLRSTYEELLARYVPPSLLVTEFHELVHCFGDARKLLTIPEGKSTANILKMLEKNLSIAVSAALHRSQLTDKQVVFKGVRASIDEMEKLFDVSVEPYPNPEQTLFLVSLQPNDVAAALETIVENYPEHNSDERISSLEKELGYTRETLQATVEELESSNEELQSTNEELVASNEELQSTNEELRSVNEELHTVNIEYKSKIDEVESLNDDLENLMSAQDVASIFLDETLSIRKFNTGALQYFDLMPTDIGRRLEHFKHRFQFENFFEVVEEVWNSGSKITDSFVDEFGSLVTLKISALHGSERIDGVVINLVNHFSQSDLTRQEFFTFPVKGAFWEWPDVRKDEMLWSNACYEMLDLEPGEIEPRMSEWKKLVHPDDLKKLKEVGTSSCVFVQKGYLSVRMKCRQEYRLFEYRGHISHDKSGVPYRILGSIAAIKTNVKNPPDEFERRPRIDT